MLRELESCAVISDPEPSFSTKNQPLTGVAFSFSPGVGLEGLLFQKY
jgi:hypothetical protein